MKKTISTVLPFMVLLIITACGSRGEIEAEIPPIVSDQESTEQEVAENSSVEELRAALGTGDVTVTLSLE